MLENSKISLLISDNSSSVWKSIEKAGRESKLTRFLLEVGDFRQRGSLKPGQKVASRYSIVGKSNDRATFLAVSSLLPTPLYFRINQIVRPIFVHFRISRTVRKKLLLKRNFHLASVIRFGYVWFIVEILRGN